MLFLLLVASVLGNPVINEQNPIKDASIGYAVDFSVVASKSQFSCLGGGGYPVAFVRAYSPAGQGTFDINSVTNINNAYAANVGLEVYITPQPMGTKSGATQLSETYNGLVKGGIRVGAVWLQVVSPNKWNNYYNENIQFIQSYMYQLSVLGISGGLYTSKTDWAYITNNWSGASGLPLWYSHVYGGGLSNESPPNYNDFSPFGGWFVPTAKQFAQTEVVCGVSPLNRDIFTLVSPAKMELTDAAGPVVGGNIKI